MSLRVYPRPEALRYLLRPRRPSSSAGTRSRAKGEGIEFADLRPFAFGDRMRRVNWRASARRGELWVNEQHPERNADVVVFLDSFAEARRGAHGTIEPAVRAASALAERLPPPARPGRPRLLRRHAALALPGTGATQLYRIIDALLDTRILLSYAWKSIDIVPCGRCRRRRS